MSGADHPTRRLPRVGRSRFGRRLFVALLAFSLIGAVLIGINAAGLLPGWRNPFVEGTTDRSQPPVLLSIKNLSRFVAAEGNFEVIIDLKKDRRFVPDWLINERTLFIAAGTVEAFVEFGQLTDDEITMSEDRASVEILLPTPALADPKLDLERSYVFAENRGLINRVSDFFDGDANRQQETLLVAEQKIAEAAAASVLVDRAKENTRKTLEGILHSLGFTTVTVLYE